MSAQKNVITGMFFLVAGIAFFIVNVNLFDAFWPLPLLSISLLIFYSLSGGASIPYNGGILLAGLLGLALFSYDMLQRLEIKNLFSLLLILLALVFLCVFFLHTSLMLQQELSQRIWPLIPAIIFLIGGLSGLLSIAVWPLFLMIGGFVLIIKGTRIY